MSVRGTRDWANELSFFNARYVPSRMYRRAKVREGTFAFFPDYEAPLPERPKLRRDAGSGAATEGSTPGLVFLDFLETVKGEAAKNGAMKGRRGEVGMTVKQQNEVRHLAWTLRPLQERLSFWTITLPKEALRALEAVDRGWESFSQRVHKELTRLLRKAGAIPWWISVTEIQMRRSARESLLCPHLHIVFVGRDARGRNRKTGRMRSGGWHLSPEVLDGIIASALKTVTGRDDFPLQSAGNVKRVKWDVGRYLSKYMTKGSGDAAYWNDVEKAKGLHIARWWHRSDAMHVRGEAHKPELHGDFGWWLNAVGPQLEALGIVSVEEREAEDFLPGGVCVRGLRRDGLRVAWNLWRELDPDWADEVSPFFPEKKDWRDWGDWRTKGGCPRLTRNVRIRPRADVLPAGVSVIPASNLDPDDMSNSRFDRISSPVADVLKERFERLYREVDVSEPVFSGVGVIGEEHQGNLPLGPIRGGVEPVVRPSGGGDPFWDDTSWRGGPR